MITQENIDQQNDAVKEWTKSTLVEIKNRYQRLISGDSGAGLKSLKTSTRKNFGEISSVSFKFDRYLVFVNKGAGKGYGGSKGSSWYDKLGNKHTTNSNSLSKMGTGNRRAKDWINPVIDEQVPKLAAIVAGFKADAAIKSIQLQ